MSDNPEEAKPATEQESSAATPTNGENGSPKVKKIKPAQPLPTSRLVLAKQLDCLRAYAVKSGTEGKSVRLAEVAEIVDMHINTVTLVNPFFSGIGLIHKREMGGYAPAPEVMNWVRAMDFNPQTAGQKLAPVIAASWFGQELLPKLAFRPMEEREAINDLADVAAVPQEFEKQLRLLLDYLEVAGLIQRDGTRIMKGSAKADTQEPAKPSPAAQEKDDSKEREKGGNDSIAGGSMRFQVDIRVDMAEVSTWRPERIAAFFNGMAAVLAAKRGVDE